MKNKIYPCLWFDNNAAEAAKFYCSVFENTFIGSATDIVVNVESSGQRFMLLNGGPAFKKNPSVSFFVNCRTTEEIDSTWNALLEGGLVLMPLGSYEWSERYGWLQDRYGVNWQLMQGRIGESQQKFVTALMYTGKWNGNAEKAINLYTGLFKGSEIKHIQRYSKEQNEPDGNILHSQFTLAGQSFVAMDSSYQHEFTFTEGISLVVECDTQDEIDLLWNALTEGGEESNCGWLRDRYGLWWQIIPSVLEKLMNDPARSERVMKAFLQMKKFDIAKLLKA